MANGINWFEPVKRYKYPHMSPADVAIWERYLALEPPTLGPVAYDVRVGLGQDPGPDYEPEIRQMAIKLTQFRIDVLNNSPTEYQIIEVKKDPGSGAIGQLLSYRNLFTNDFPEMVPVSLFLLCNRITPDVVTVCNSYRILYKVV